MQAKACSSVVVIAIGAGGGEGGGEVLGGVVIFGFLDKSVRKVY